MAHFLRHHLIARLALASVVALVVLLVAGPSIAEAVQAPATPTAPATGNGVNVSIDTGTDGGSSTAIQVLVVMTILALAPSILIMMTGFTRILIVMGFVRNALGTPTMPPNQVLIGLSLFLTLFVMFPTFSAINNTAIEPYQAKEITQQQAIDAAQAPIREFMFAQVDEEDLALFVRLAAPRSRSASARSTTPSTAGVAASTATVRATPAPTCPRTCSSRPSSSPSSRPRSRSGSSSSSRS